MGAMDLGDVQMSHRVTALGLATYALGAVFLLGLAGLAFADPFRSDAEPWKRWAIGAFLGACGVGMAALCVELGLTRVDVCERGLRRAGWKTEEVRWSDVRSLELVRVNGKPAALVVHATTGTMRIPGRLEGFDVVVSIAQSRAGAV